MAPTTEPYDPAFDAPPKANPDLELTLTHDERERHYLLHYPPAYYDGRRDLPLIIAFHGKNQEPRRFAFETGLSDDTINSEYMVAYPSGVQGQWMGDPSSPREYELNDVAFVARLLDKICCTRPVNSHKVFVLGFSNGAGLAALVACNNRLSKRIRAVCMAASAIYLDDPTNDGLFGRFDAKRFPVPLLEFHGDADPVIDYNGVDTPDGPSWPIGDWIRSYTWMSEKGLNDGELLREEPREQLFFDGQVERYAWYCGTDKEIVVHYLIHGFGHGWPTTTPLPNDELRHGPTVLDATPIALEFFREAAKLKPYRIEWDG